MRRAIAVPFVLAALALQGSDPTSAAGKRWWSHVTTLSSDMLQGRDAGSEGHRTAAEYVAGQFKAAGLEPGNKGQFLQPVALESRAIDEASSSIALIDAQGKEVPVKLGEQAYFNVRIDLAPEIDAPLVFAGNGLSVPSENHDDLAGLDLKGKVVVYISGAPSTLPGAVQAHNSSSAVRAKALADAGAVGAIAISNPKNQDLPWERASGARLQPAMTLADPALDTSKLLRFGAAFNPAHAQMLFEGAPQSLAQLLAIADRREKLPGFPLAFRVRAKAAVRRASLTSDNVVGLLEGSDRRLRNEYVVLTAHLDHIGVNPNLKGDQINNGAMDNASGIATLIETARDLSSGRVLRRPSRSILFVAVTAEEKGLLGSRYFANRPPVPAGSMVANVNMDMFLPLHPMTLVMAMGLEESTLRKPLEEAAKGLGLRVQPDPEPLRNRFIRSDQYNFILRGIPALALKVGYEEGSPQEKLQKEWIRTRYHAPGDDAAQPVDFDAAVTFNRLIRELALGIANEKKRPEWNKDSFFRQFAPASSKRK
ncbi:MAG: M28 family metallopeptidase [Bryobacteraceae bacterium]